MLLNRQTEVAQSERVAHNIRGRVAPAGSTHGRKASLGVKCTLSRA